MKSEQEFTYSDPTKEEGEIFNKELEVLCEKHSMTLMPKPFLTMEGKIDAQIIILKKTPKEDGTNTEETSKATE